MRLLFSMILAFCCASCSPADVGTVQWIKAQYRAPAEFTPAAPESTPFAAASVSAAVRPDDAETTMLSDVQMLRLGAQLFAFNCAPCHRSNGEGNLHRFPALNDSPLVTAQMPQPLIETVLYGRQVMPAFSPTLNNVELASVLSYIRHAWGNQASMIEPRQIQDVRRGREQ